MRRPADLLAHLRAADEHLAALAPGAHVEARLRARMRGEAASPRGPFGGAGLRLRRPLLLAFAVAAGALIVGHNRGPSADRGGAVAGVPSAPPEPIREPIAADRDPPDPTLGPRRASPSRMIHAPTLEEAPARRRGDPPRPPSFVAPRSAPTGTPLPERLLLDSNDTLPAPTPEHRKEGLGPTVRAESKIFGAPAPAPSGTTPVTAPPGYSRSPQTDPSLTSSRGPAGASDEDPSANCKFASELSDEGHQRCAQKGLVVDELTFVSSCGDGRFRDVAVQCTEESKPDPGENVCTSREFGDGVACQGDANILKQKIWDLCAQEGLILTSLSVVTEGCSTTQFTKATYLCCAPTPPPEAPVYTCTTGELGDDQTCQDNAAYQQAAEQACKIAGLALDAAKFTMDCADGQSTKSYYLCCSASKNQ